MINILSLGAGVQSSALAVMAANGEVQQEDGTALKLDHAIFADTQAEPKSVYDWLDKLIEYIKGSKNPFPVHIVTNGSLDNAETQIRTSKGGRLYIKSAIPSFILSPEGKTGLMRRVCTSDYKVIPIQRKTRELVGVRRNGLGIVKAKLWLGISTDEASRMKPSRVDYLENIYPLIDMGLSRDDCLAYVEAKLAKPPRSACYFCPFHSTSEWKRMKTEEPQEFDRAVKFEKDMQSTAAKQTALRGIPFLHSTCKPLDSIDFDALLARKSKQLDLFNNECFGMCGV